jgi:hypothetical protein
MPEGLPALRVARGDNSLIPRDQGAITSNSKMVMSLMSLRPNGRPAEGA